MRKTIPALLLTVAALGLTSAQDQPNTLTRQESAEGWKLLFDGKTMTGWEMHNADNWSVKDGSLACPADKASWLGTAGSYTDFHLRLAFRLGEKGNSGVFLRSQKEGAPAETGYELQIWDFRRNGFNTGSLVNALEATAPSRFVADQWNEYDVTAQGDHFVVLLNGKTVLDGHDSKHASGVIGLQANPDHIPVEFRNIRVVELKK